MQFTTEPKDMTDQTETDTQFVRRIIAMLLSLAGIAERAAKRSYPVRAFLLWVLRRAEKAAQDLVGVEDLWAGAIRGNGPDDAIELADSFRELAEFLCEDLAQDRIFQSWWGDDSGHEAANVAEATERGFSLAGHLFDIVGRLAATAGFAPVASRLAGFSPIPRLDSS